MAIGLYRRLPEEVRRCLRPLNLLDEAASLLPGRLRAPLASIAEAGRLLLPLHAQRYPVRRVTGAAPDGSPLAALLAMDDLSTRGWTRTLFAGPVREETLGEIRALDAPRTVPARLDDVDVVLWQTPWPLGHLADGPRVPSLVTLWMPTDRALEDVYAGDAAGREARRQEIKRVQRLGLTVRVTRDAATCEDFRRRLYEPYVRARFGDLVVPLAAHAFRHARRQGWVLLAEQAGVPVAGALLERAGDVLRLRAFGADPAGPIPAAAAIAACYYHVIRSAVESGFRRLSFGTCRPVLTDGVLHYKRKWGGRIGAPLGRDAFLLRFRNTPALRAALAASPLVVDLGGERLAALGAVRDVSELRASATRLLAPGLVASACLVAHAPASVPVGLHVVPPSAVWPAAA